MHGLCVSPSPASFASRRLSLVIRHFSSRCSVSLSLSLSLPNEASESSRNEEVCGDDRLRRPGLEAVFELGSRLPPGEFGKSPLQVNILNRTMSGTDADWAGEFESWSHSIPLHQAGVPFNCVRSSHVSPSPQCKALVTHLSSGCLQSFTGQRALDDNITLVTESLNRGFKVGPKP